MQEAFDSLQHKMAPAEEIFFTWLTRVFAAAVLAGSAWIDDAPPLEIVAMVIALYVVLRVVSQFGALASAAPFKNPVPRNLFAFIALVLLAGVFLIVVIFVNSLSLHLVG